MSYGLILRRVSFAMALPLSIACASLSVGAETATLKGKFVLDGEAPAVEVIKPDRDVEICGKHNLVRESLVLGKDGAIENVFVWLYGPKDKLKGGEAPATAATLDNHGCRFAPHALAMQVGQKLEVKNSDPMGHNTEGHPRSNKEFNSTIAPGGTLPVEITKPERFPFEVKCGIHPWMKGFVLVTEGPFAAVSGADGGFEIKDLPAGTPLEFQVWQERKGNVKDVTVDGKKTTWNLGRFKMTLKPGVNDLGTIKAKIGG